MQHQKSSCQSNSPIFQYCQTEKLSPYTKNFERMYRDLFLKKLDLLKKDGQYREFVTLNRICGQYPSAYLNGNKSNIVTVAPKVRKLRPAAT